MPLMRARVISIIALLGAMSLSPFAHAEILVVPDGNVAALISAIQTANSNGEADVINLASNGTYLLTSVNNENDGSNGLPIITSRITIEGHGAAIKRSVISVVPEFRILYVLEPGHLTVNDLTLENGSASLWGGGILNNAGTLDLVNTNLFSNHAAVFGGGITNLGGGSELTDCTINENHSDVFGGGVFNFSGFINIINSTIQDNNADFDGGGVYNNIDGIVQLINSTVSGNHAGESGGGAYNFGGTFRLTNVTVAANDALKEGGGLINLLGGSFTMSNSIIANQSGELNCAGEPIISQGHNLDSDGSCQLSGPGDLNQIDPMLGPLKRNGGATMTHAPLFGSPVIDAGESSVCLPEDQRGLMRPFEGSNHTSQLCDIGAVEFVDCNGDNTNDTANLDTDGDGTANCQDGCPDNPNKIAPGACGCDSEDRDSDGDGVLDCLEGCPLDPNKLDPGICGCGNADTLVDSDSDGLIDCLDNCPFVANTNQLDIDHNGIGDVCEPSPIGQSVGPCGTGVGVVMTPMTMLGLGLMRRRRRRSPRRSS